MLTAKEAFETAKKANEEIESNLLRYAISVFEEEIYKGSKMGEMEVRIPFHFIFPEFRIEFRRKENLFAEIKKYFEPYGYQVVFFDKYIKVDWSRA